MTKVLADLFNNFRQGVVSSCYDDKNDGKMAVMQFRDFRRRTMLALFDVCAPFPSISPSADGLTQNYVLNMASTLPLDALRIVTWSHVWFEDIYPSA